MVVRVLTRLNIGGPARQALLLGRELAAEFPTLTVSGRPRNDEGELFDRSLPHTNVPMVRPIRPLSDLRALAAMRRVLRTHQPAILHTHMAKAGFVGRLAAVSLPDRPKLVHTYHGHVLSGYFRAPAQRGFLELERRLARRTDTLLAVSSQVRDELLDLGVGRPDQYRVIPVGLDLSRHLRVAGPDGRLRAQLGLASAVPLVGVLGRLVPIKDHLTLFRAVAELPCAHLVVLGDGELRAALEAAVREIGIAGRVSFTGWWADTAAAISDLDVIALSSRNEGTPTALIEALAAGRPVVATDVGGVRSVVVDGKSGFVVPPADPVALGSALARLLADPELRRRMGTAGRADVATRFGSRPLVDAHRDLYRELTQGAPE